MSEEIKTTETVEEPTQETKKKKKKSEHRERPVVFSEYTKTKVPPKYAYQLNDDFIYDFLNSRSNTDDKLWYVSLLEDDAYKSFVPVKDKDGNPKKDINGNVIKKQILNKNKIYSAFMKRFFQHEKKSAAEIAREKLGLTTK